MRGGGLTLGDLGGGMLGDLVATLAGEGGGGGAVLQFKFFFAFL